MKNETLEALRACKPSPAQIEVGPRCEWTVPCSAPAACRAIVRGPSSLVVEDRLLCGPHADVTVECLGSPEARAEGWAVALLALPDPFEPKEA